MKRFFQYTLFWALLIAVLSGTAVHNTISAEQVSFSLRPFNRLSSNYASASSIKIIRSEQAIIDTVKTKNSALKKLNTSKPQLGRTHHSPDEQRPLQKRIAVSFKQITKSVILKDVKIDAPKIFNNESLKSETKKSNELYVEYLINKPSFKATAIDSTEIKVASWVSHFESSDYKDALAKVSKDEKELSEEVQKISTIKAEIPELIAEESGPIALLPTFSVPTISEDLSSQEISTPDLLETAPIEPVEATLTDLDTRPVDLMEIPEVVEETKIGTSPFYDRSVSPAVARAISREQKKSKVTTHKVYADKVDYSQAAPQKTEPNTQVDTQDGFEGFLAAAQKSNEGGREIIITPNKFEFSRGNSGAVKDFELWPWAMPNEKIHDEGTGAAKIKIDTDDNVLVGATLMAPGFVTTRILISTMEKSEKIVVPLIGNEDFEKFIEKESISTEGGALLIDRDEGIDGVDVNVHYKAKVFLNDEWEISNREEGQRYVLYLGVQSGRAIVSYRTSDNEVLRKEVWLKDGEITFDYNFIRDVESKNIALLGLNLLGSDPHPATYDEKNVAPYLSKKSTRKLNLNLYQTPKEKKASGTMDFIKIAGEKEEILISTDRMRDTINLLSQSALQAMMDDFGYDQSRMECLVQIDLSKNIKDATFVAEGEFTEEQTAVRYWTREGDVSERFISSAQRIFVHVNPSQLSYEITYLDGTKEVSSVVCAKNRYMILSH